MKTNAAKLVDSLPNLSQTRLEMICQALVKAETCLKDKYELRRAMKARQSCDRLAHLWEAVRALEALSKHKAMKGHNVQRRDRALEKYLRVS